MDRNCKGNKISYIKRFFQSVGYTRLVILIKNILCKAEIASLYLLHSLQENLSFPLRISIIINFIQTYRVDVLCRE